MGKKQEQPKQKVGNAFFSSFAIAVANKVDIFKSVWIDEEKIAELPNDAIQKSMYLMTGKKSDQYPSSTGKSNLQLFNGINNPINYFLSKISNGIITKYKGVAYAFFNDAFIGDNVQNYPSYGFEVQRTNIIGWKYNNQLLDEIITFDGTKQANPSIVLYYILNKIAQIPSELIDSNSFYDAAKILKDEKFGIALIINKENDLKNIIEEVIRHIDATFYFNIKTGKYTLKLLRNDYNVNNLIEITDEDINEVNYKKSTYNDLSTHVILNYISPVNYKKATIYAENPSIKLIAKNEKSTECNFLCIQDKYLAEKILNREFKKYCTPLATIKFKVPNSFNLEVFDVFKLTSEKLKIKNMICRVLEKSADEYEKNYYEITATEDIYSENDYEIITTQDDLVEKINYSISENSKIISNILCLNKDITGIDEYPCLLINDSLENGNNEYADIDYITYNNKLFSQKTEKYTKLKKQINLNKTNIFLDEIEIEKQSWMQNELLTDEQFQQNQRLVIINDEVLSYKEMIIIDSTTVKLKNLFRNINNTTLSIHNVDDNIFFINSFEIFELTNFINNSEYAELSIVVANKLNQTIPKVEYFNDFDNYYKPYDVENVNYDINTKILTFNTTNVNKNYTASYKTIEEIEKNITSLTENKIEDNQYFKLVVKYEDLTTEIIDLYNTTTYTFSKKLKKGDSIIYNVLNNVISNGVYF